MLSSWSPEEDTQFCVEVNNMLSSWGPEEDTQFCFGVNNVCCHHRDNMARSLLVENILPQNMGSIINYLQ